MSPEPFSGVPWVLRFGTVPVCFIVTGRCPCLPGSAGAWQEGCCQLETASWHRSTRSACAQGQKHKGRLSVFLGFKLCLCQLPAITTQILLSHVGINSCVGPRDPRSLRQG